MRANTDAYIAWANTVGRFREREGNGRCKNKTEKRRGKEAVPLWARERTLELKAQDKTGQLRKESLHVREDLVRVQ